MTAIACNDVMRRYASGTEALGPLDLNIRQGEFVSLLGPSGCGKSTLLRIIAGLDAPSTGSIRIDAGGRASSGGIGFVFQEPTLMPWASVRDNIRLPLRLTGDMSAAGLARIEDLLARMGLVEFAGAFPRELSGGMKMRASLARALVTDPDILLLDEPFAALDEITRFRLNNDLLALWRDLRKTVVFVTHSVFESVFLSQRVVVLTARPGRIFAERAIDTPEPRDENFRTSATYAGFCREVSAMLAQASDKKG